MDDGRRFIETAQNPYDIIFLDAFDSENIPYRLTTQEFLRAVHKALSPHGVVVANVWSRASNPMHDSMVRTYQDVFPNLYLVEVQGAGNEVILGWRQEQRLDRDDIAQAPDGSRWRSRFVSTWENSSNTAGSTSAKTVLMDRF